MRVGISLRAIHREQEVVWVLPSSDRAEKLWDSPLEVGTEKSILLIRGFSQNALQRTDAESWRAC